MRKPDTNVCFYEYFAKSVIGRARCLSYFGRSFSGNEVVRRINGIAKAFAEKGIQKGDVVAIHLPNSPECVFSLYALNKLGAVVFVTHPMLPPHALSSDLKQAKARFLICRAGEDREIPIERITCDLTRFLTPLKRLAGRFAGRVKENITFPYDAIGDLSIESETQGEDLALYLPSGGTTGEPKIIKIRNSALNKNAEATVSLAKIDLTGERVLLALPLYHGFGLSSALHGAVSGGAEGVIVPYFNAKKIAKEVCRGNITIILGVPNMFRKLTDEKPFQKGIGHMTLAFSGGDSLPEKLKIRYDSLAEKKGSESRLYQGYGLAETVSVCAACSFGEDKVGSIGKPVNAEIRIIKDTGEEAKEGEIGEISVSTDSMMDGYIGNEFEQGTSLLTGDLGYKDKDGFLFFTGRKKRIIVIGGMNVYPVEIERAAMTLPFVQDATAMEYIENEKPKIVLFCSDNSEYSEDYKTQKIFEVLSSSVIRYAIPSRILFLREFPKTAIGKTDYDALSKIAVESGLGSKKI